MRKKEEKEACEVTFPRKRFQDEIAPFRVSYPSLRLKTRS